MAGTKLGGKKAAAANKIKYGADFYQRIGRKGGSRVTGKGGFASNPELARTAGAKGGRISKRGDYSYKVNKIEPLADKIREEYANGDSLTAIAKRHKISYGVLSKWSREHLDIKTWEDKGAYHE